MPAAAMYVLPTVLIFSIPLNLVLNKSWKSSLSTPERLVGGGGAAHLVKVANDFVEEAEALDLLGDGEGAPELAEVGDGGEHDGDVGATLAVQLLKAPICLRPGEARRGDSEQGSLSCRGSARRRGWGGGSR